MNELTQKKYALVACGGTFDLLHAGHKAFLRFAFSVGERVLIGLTSDEYLKTFGQKNTRATFEERKKNLQNFLQEEFFLESAEIVSIDDPFGPAVRNDRKIEALVVTEKTKKGAQEINAIRGKNGLAVLDVVSMSLLQANGREISSTNIRNGIMNQQGRLFVSPEYFTNTYILPEQLRHRLQKPFGHVFAQGQEQVNKLNPEKIITVGDVTTAWFNKEYISQKISVIDFTVERKKYFTSVDEIGFTGSEEFFSVVNPAGSLTADTFKTISLIAGRLQEKKRFVVTVQGEEDLLFIPLLLIFPIGFHIFYGQPHIGMVQCDVSLENKIAMDSLFRQFVPQTTRGH